ncbi:MAG: response regulator, partial [Gemmatimonadetes bacterium]|nr:response regulator [Gemmatimonadota bacterium]
MSEPAPDAVAGEPTSLQLRVLVVDDDRVDRMAIRRALTRVDLGARVDEADSAPAALERVATGEFDCVFLDYNLPGSDGLHVLRAIRSGGTGTPVVMLTGQGDERVAVELMKAGAADYLPKDGATPERLAASLRYALELGRAEAQAREAEAALHESVERTRFLAEASRVLAGSLDVQNTLRTLARLSVPLLGDYCVLYLTHESGEYRSVAAAHADPAREDLVRAVERHYRPTRDHATSFVAGVIRTRRTHIAGPVPDAHLESLSRTPEDLEVFRQLRAEAVLVVPLEARGTVLGAMMFIRSAPGSAYPPAEVELAEDLARRAAVAIDNARLFEAAEHARAQAEEANRAKSEFLARMSHDLRTPLNAIGGYAELIEMGIRGPVTDTQRDDLRRIQQSQKHLLGLINEVLN